MANHPEPPTAEPASARPPAWAFLLAFTTVYVAYGLNYLAIKIGDRTLPPFLFAGSHVTLAGLLFFTWLILRRESFALSWANVGWAALGGIVVFVGGTGLVTAGEKAAVNSGMASLLRATTPVWIALLEWLRPKGERLSGRAWIGFLAAITGVALLLVPKFEDAASFRAELGPLLVLGSALSWAVGAFLLRHRRPSPSNTVATAYQMTFGGLFMILLGLALGEGRDFHAAELTTDALWAFGFLLVVHSLVGFSVLNWLLSHVSAPLAMTKFYVSPAVAVVVGSLVLQEQITGGMVGGMALILGGVVLALLPVSQKKRPHARPADAQPVASRR